MTRAPRTRSTSLAGEGAAIVIAGLDAASAGRASRWAEHHRLPIVVLAAAEPLDDASFAFSLGVPRRDVIQALERVVPGLTTGLVAPVIDGSEVDGYPANMGATDLHLAAPVPCDTQTGRAGETRFPIGPWEAAEFINGSSAGQPAAFRTSLSSSEPHMNTESLP